ncbi:unnamed protein product [Polarella glacialis]|uniref:Uncharacterized protein n=1 Tax=Polarella glacialis TaxID=89957 RepID=A0A813IL93_POLGL|nr:unnamed protein product [Polarella glacialis]
MVKGWLAKGEIDDGGCGVARNCDAKVAFGAKEADDGDEEEMTEACLQQIFLRVEVERRRGSAEAKAELLEAELQAAQLKGEVEGAKAQAAQLDELVAARREAAQLPAQLAAEAAAAAEAASVSAQVTEQQAAIRKAREDMLDPSGLQEQVLRARDTGHLPGARSGAHVRQQLAHEERALRSELGSASKQLVALRRGCDAREFHLQLLEEEVSSLHGVASEGPELRKSWGSSSSSQAGALPKRPRSSPGNSTDMANDHLWSAARLAVSNADLQRELSSTEEASAAREAALLSRREQLEEALEERQRTTREVPGAALAAASDAGGSFCAPESQGAEAPAPKSPPPTPPTRLRSSPPLTPPRRLCSAERLASPQRSSPGGYGRVTPDHCLMGSPPRPIAATPDYCLMGSPPRPAPAGSKSPISSRQSPISKSPMEVSILGTTLELSLSSSSSIGMLTLDDSGHWRQVLGFDANERGSLQEELAAVHEVEATLPGRDDSIPGDPVAHLLEHLSAEAPDRYKAAEVAAAAAAEASEEISRLQASAARRAQEVLELHGALVDARTELAEVLAEASTLQSGHASLNSELTSLRKQVLEDHPKSLEALRRRATEEVEAAMRAERSVQLAAARRAAHCETAAASGSRDASERFRGGRCLVSGTQLSSALRLWYIRFWRTTEREREKEEGGDASIKSSNPKPDGLSSEPLRAPPRPSCLASTAARSDASLAAELSGLQKQQQDGGKHRLGGTS